MGEERIRQREQPEKRPWGRRLPEEPQGGQRGCSIEWAGGSDDNTVSHSKTSLRAFEHRREVIRPANRLLFPGYAVRTDGKRARTGPGRLDWINQGKKG